MVRLHAFFKGAVQGVGFRYTTERMARRLPVAGFVRNLPTGEVELVAEGEEAVLQDFLKEIKKSFEGYLHGTDVKWGKATGEFRDFGIEF